MATDTELDFDAFYRVEGMDGIAWSLCGYATTEREIQFDWTDPDDGETYYEYEIVTEENPDVVIAVMVGDNRRHEIDVDDLTKISEDDFCFGCGQIGCGH